MNKIELSSIVRNALNNALVKESLGYDGGEEPKEIRKARLAGSTQARQRFASSTPEELQRAYLEIEKKASTETDDLKNTFLWGACDAIGKMLKSKGLRLPRASKDGLTG